MSNNIQQVNLNDIPLLNLVTESVSTNFAGVDLIDGKLGYNVTTNELITVISSAVVSMLTSGDIATGADITSAAAGKLIDVSLIARSGDTPANLNLVLPTLQRVIDEVTASNVGDVKIRGGLVGTGNLTGNATGNAYLDAVADVLAGDKFIITTDGSLTASDGTIAVKTGDTITMLNAKSKATLLIADVLFVDAGVINAIDVAFDNSGSNLVATNSSAAIKEVNAKFASSFYEQNGLAFTASQVRTIVHNLNSAKISVKMAIAGSGVFNEVAISSASRTLNQFAIQIDVAGTYDILVTNLVKV